jgi:HEAT repeat protein
MSDKGGSPTLSAIMQAFHGNNDTARRDAAEALANIGVSAIPILLESLKRKSHSFPWWAPRAKERDRKIRSFAAWTLGEIGDASAVPALTQVTTDSTENEYVRFHAATALGKIGDASAVPALTQVITKEYGSADLMHHFIFRSAAQAVNQIAGEHEDTDQDDENETEDTDG